MRLGAVTDCASASSAKSLTDTRRWLPSGNRTGHYALRQRWIVSKRATYPANDSRNRISVSGIFLKTESRHCMAAIRKTTGAAMPRPSQLLLGMHYTKTVSFDEERARTVFREVGDRYRMGVGFFSGVRRIQPQHLYTPAELKELGGLEL